MTPHPAARVSRRDEPLESTAVLTPGGRQQLSRGTLVLECTHQRRGWVSATKDPSVTETEGARMAQSGVGPASYLQPGQPGQAGQPLPSQL